MAQGSLFPAFVVIDYHSAFGAHKMTLPTAAWHPSVGVTVSGEFLAWDSSDIDADDMINELIELIAVFFKTDTSFDLYTVYTMLDVDAIPNPVASAALGIPGSITSGEWSKALQTTFTFRTDVFSIMKLVLLDAPSGNQFDKINSFGASPEALAILAALSATTNAWSARIDGRPNVLAQIAYTLNDKLRREYNMN